MRQLAYVKRVAKRVKEHISTLRWATLQKECSARGIRTHGRGRTKDVLRYELQLKMIEEELSKAMIDGQESDPEDGEYEHDSYVEI